MARGTKSKGQRSNPRGGNFLQEAHLASQRHAIKCHVEPEFTSVDVLVPDNRGTAQEFECAPTREQVIAFNNGRRINAARAATFHAADRGPVQ